MYDEREEGREEGTEEERGRVRIYNFFLYSLWYGIWWLKIDIFLFLRGRDRERRY